MPVQQLSADRLPDHGNDAVRTGGKDAMPLRNKPARPTDSKNRSRSKRRPWLSKRNGRTSQSEDAVPAGDDLSSPADVQVAAIDDVMICGSPSASPAGTGDVVPREGKVDTMAEPGISTAVPREERGNDGKEEGTLCRFPGNGGGIVSSDGIIADVPHRRR